VQIERVPSQLRISAFRTLAAPHEFNKQRDRALDDGLRLREQSLALSSHGGTLREQRAGRGALSLCASEEVCAHCGEWAPVDQERGASFDVEAPVGEWAEGQKSQRRRFGW
jgi:hypothetical protein